MVGHRLICVDPQRVHEFWPYFRESIRGAIEKVGVSNFEPIERGVLSGVDLLWLAHDGAKVHASAVTSLNGDVLEIVACAGGGLKDFLPLIEGLEKYGRAEGCKTSRIIGRAGWERMLKNYKRTAVILERPL